MAAVWEQRATLQPAAAEILWGRVDSGPWLSMFFPQTPPPASPIVEPRQRGRKHWGTHQHHRLLDLVTRKPTTWTPNPRPVFHSISPTITCNTHLLPHLTEARVNVNAPMLEIDGALPHSVPHIGLSGLILSILAKLGLDSKVQHLMTVSVPQCWTAQPLYTPLENLQKYRQYSLS